MEKKSNASSPVILLLSVFFIFTESIRIFTGEKEPYYTEDMQLIWLTGAWFLVIAALLLACFILCIRGKRLWWHRLLRIPLTMYFLYCGGCRTAAVGRLWPFIPAASADRRYCGSCGSY